MILKKEFSPFAYITVQKVIRYKTIYINNDCLISNFSLLFINILTII